MDVSSRFDWDAGNLAKCQQHTGGIELVRPISAGFMHRKEIDRYEQLRRQESPGSADG